MPRPVEGSPGAAAVRWSDGCRETAAAECGREEGARARGGRRHGHGGRGGGGCERAARQAVTTEERQVPREADHHVPPVTLTHTTGTVAKTHSSTLCNYKHKHWPGFPPHATHIGHEFARERHTHTRRPFYAAGLALTQSTALLKRVRLTRSLARWPAFLARLSVYKKTMLVHFCAAAFWPKNVSVPSFA